MTPSTPRRPCLHGLALAALALCAGPGIAQAATYANLLVQQRADPSVYRHTDGYYYLTYSVPEYDRIAIRRSTTLQGLGSAAEVVIWSRHASGEMSANIWAPWLDYVNGQWYVYFAAAQAGNAFNHRLYALSNGAANPVTAAGWVEQGKIAMNWESFSIDATTFAQGGTRYMV